jgi:alpha-D-xyloside xylohydrolase
MKRREFLSLGVSAAALAQIPRTTATQPLKADPVHPGIWKVAFGAPEAITPVRTRHYAPATSALTALPRVETCPVNVSARRSRRGVLVTIPLQANELVYGLGLQMQSFIQRGLKKKLRVNADPVIDSGDSHAPVPFYVTTRGYGVLVDTARYGTFYFGGPTLRLAILRYNLLPAAARCPAMGTRHLVPRGAGFHGS